MTGASTTRTISPTSTPSLSSFLSMASALSSAFTRVGGHRHPSPLLRARHSLLVPLDVWSRLSGGSGAPGWTLEAVGFDLSDDGRAFDEAGAAYLGGVREGGETLDERGRWPTGYQKLVCATMKWVPSLSLASRSLRTQC